MTRIMIVAIVALSVAPANADVFTYACKAKGKRSIVKIDTVKHTFQWAGKTYIIKDAQDGNCPRFGWNVVGNGKSFDFCPATQGMADFHLDGRDVQCDQKS